MRRIERRLWVVALVIVLSACGRQADEGFCATHGQSHWQHRDQQPSLVVGYEQSGRLAVALALPTSESNHSSVVSAADILALPAHCKAGELKPETQGEQTLLRFDADCGEELPAQLSVPLLQNAPELDEVEVSMTTPAVHKHFVVHRDCERAIFNLAEGPADG